MTDRAHVHGQDDSAKSADVANDYGEDVSAIHVVSPFRAGRVVADKYLIERELALGGVGVVMLATHLDLGHFVAIKVLRPHLRDQPTIVERFKREARLAASLHSEHVVRIHDVGMLDDETPFTVMEYLDGEDLSTIRARGLPLATEVVVDWICQACEALSEAHASGIIHRDLKPENIFLARRTNRADESIIKVVDFGISKMTESGDAPSSGPTSIATSSKRRPRMQLTLGNESFGTPQYMSPEQLMSATSADARSDIWALGVVLYEMLTLTLPFEGSDVRQLTASILTSSPTPIRAKRPEVSAELEAIVMSCLARHPKDRPSSMADLQAALAPFRAQRETLMPAPLSAPKRSTKKKTSSASPARSAAPLAVALGVLVVLWIIAMWRVFTS